MEKNAQERDFSLQLVLCFGGVVGGVESEGGIFLPGTLRDGGNFNIIRTPGSLETQRYVKEGFG